MSGRRMAWLTAVAVMLAASPAWADGGGGDLGGLISRLVNFAVAVGVLVWIFTRVFSLKQFFAARRATIENDLEESRQQLEGAKVRLGEIQERVSRQQEEVEKVVASGQRQAEVEAQRIVEAGHERSQRIAEMARLAQQQEEKRLEEEVRREAVETALVAAEGLVTSALNDADHHRLVEEALS